MQENRMETKEPSSIDPQHQLPPASTPHKSGWQRLFVWAALLLTFAVIFYLVLHHHEDQSAAPSSRRAVTGPVTVTAAVAQQGNIPVYLVAIGTVTPVYTASITSEVTGMISKVYYKEGQLVRKGEALIDIDARPFEAQLMQAEGALERDTNLLAQAKMDLQRYRDAWARNAIPKQTLDDQEKIVLQDEGTVKNDQGTVQYDQVQVDYCHIAAPVTGRVGLRLVDPGNVVQSSGALTLAVVTQIQPITVIFTVPEDNLGQVQQRLRKNAKLTVDAFDRSALKKIANGVLLTLDNQIDTTTGT